jgi:hypothetical protein
MTVYVDDADILATVGRHTSHWSHLYADTPEELHEFAARLGLRRSWFQEPKGRPGKPVVPHSLKAQMWHYDVTAPKRAEAIRLGAKPITTTEGTEIIRARHARQFPEEAVRLEQRRAELFAKYRAQ